MIFKPLQGQVGSTTTHQPLDVRTFVGRGKVRAGGIDPGLPPGAPPRLYPAGVAKDVHVLIASVPWRRNSLNRLLRDVAAQSVKPAKVHIVLDGGVGGPIAVLPQPLVAAGIPFSIRENVPARGAGARWDLVHELADTDVICNLDDDVGLRADYLAIHRGALDAREVVCSGGYNGRKLIMCNRTDVTYDGPIHCAQAGAFSARVRSLRGMHTMPMAPEMLGMLGDDEGLISAHLWKHGITVYRVNAPVLFDHSVADDPRSQYRQAPLRITKLRTRLKSLTGWPWGL